MAAFGSGIIRLVRFHRVQVVRTMPHPGRGSRRGRRPRGARSGSRSGTTASALRRYELGAGSVAAQAELEPEFRRGDLPGGGPRLAAHLARADPAELGRRDARAAEEGPYNREGWGCARSTAVGRRRRAAADVLTSDGTSELVRRDPVTLEPREVVHVRCRGQRVSA